MQNDYESILNRLISSQGGNAAKSMEKIKQTFQSGEGLEIIKRIAKSNPDILSQLTSIAASKDSESAKAMISRLMSTKDGAEAASMIIRMLGE